MYIPLPTHARARSFAFSSAFALLPVLLVRLAQKTEPWWPAQLFHFHDHKDTQPGRLGRWVGKGWGGVCAYLVHVCAGM